jgi:hypothetical protein
VSDTCEQDNGLLDSINYEKILGQLTRLLKGSAQEGWNERNATNIALKITWKEAVATSKTYYPRIHMKRLRAITKNTFIFFIKVYYLWMICDQMNV